MPCLVKNADVRRIKRLVKTLCQPGIDPALNFPVLPCFAFILVHSQNSLFCAAYREVESRREKREFMGTTFILVWIFFFIIIFCVDLGLWLRLGFVASWKRDSFRKPKCVSMALEFCAKSTTQKTCDGVCVKKIRKISMI